MMALANQLGSGPMPPWVFKQIRHELQLEQTQLANVLGYAAQSRISELETGRAHIPGRVKLIMLALASGWRPPHWDKLINGEERETI